MTGGMCVYPDPTMGGHGVRRTRKVCRAQPRALARARTPCFHKRVVLQMGTFPLYRLC